MFYVCSGKSPAHTEKLVVAYLSVEVRPCLERIIVVVSEPRPEFNEVLTKCRRTLDNVSVDKLSDATAGMMRQEFICLVDDAADKEVDLFLIGVGEGLQQLRVKPIDAVVCQLDNAVDGVVDVADYRRGRVQQFVVDDVAEGLVGAFKADQLPHRHHRLGLDAAVYVDCVEIAVSDVGPRAASQQWMNEHIRQHRSRHRSIVCHLEARRRTGAFRYVARVLCNILLYSLFMTLSSASRNTCNETVILTQKSHTEFLWFKQPAYL